MKRLDQLTTEDLLEEFDRMMGVDEVDETEFYQLSGNQPDEMLEAKEQYERQYYRLYEEAQRAAKISTKRRPAADSVRKQIHG